MKTLDAIRAKMFPYELPDETLELLLEEQDLQASEEYDGTSDKNKLLSAVVSALYQLTTLVKEKDNGSEVQYSSDAIYTLIKRYENELKGDSRRGANRDMTHIW